MSQLETELAKYGQVYTSHLGQKYVKTPNTSMGIRIDTVRAFEGIVESVTKLEVWREVRLREQDTVFWIHQNWITDNGEIKAGDKLEGILRVNEIPWLAWYVRRIQEQKEALVGE